MNTGYAISEAKAAHREAVARQNKLIIELAHLESPQRIVNIAQKKLGLVRPANEQRIRITK